MVSTSPWPWPVPWPIQSVRLPWCQFADPDTLFTHKLEGTTDKMNPFHCQCKLLKFNQSIFTVQRPFYSPLTDFLVKSSTSDSHTGCMSSHFLSSRILVFSYPVKVLLEYCVCNSVFLFHQAGLLPHILISVRAPQFSQLHKLNLTKS